MSRQCLSEVANTCDRHHHHHHHHLHNHQHHHYDEGDGSGFILSGYHKKLKTMKKKYFVLYRDSMDNVARLEYYDNDKKFKSGFNAKRIIKLRNCFNISRRMDTKYEFVIALATKEGGFGIVVESEVEMNKWLNNLLSLQRKYCGEFDLPLFDHVWQVVIQRKGLAEQKGLIGNYHVCLTSKSITFLKISSARSTVGNGNSQRLQRVDVLLTTVRRCGDSQCYFYMEIGRQSTIGPGELWMETEDSLIAKNMHGMILNKMTSINETQQVEPMRKRSSSATEATKPINDIQRKIVQTLSTNLIRKRCDSLPSRNSVTNNDSMSTAASTSTKSATTTVSTTSCQQQLNNSSGTMINSESEESSASFEESDDAVPYSLYRLNTQNTSDGIIPEEGPDDPCTVEKSLKDSNDINTDNLKYGLAGVQAPSNLKPANINGKYLQHINNNKYVADKHSKEFSLEYNMDVINNVATNESELCSLRPVRAYSVGNRIQHNNLQVIREKCDESSDNFVGRVRAFSVGSKTKAAKFENCPRSSPRAMMHICSSINNNNNYCNNNNNNNNGLYCIMDGNAKKSTSVPLLSSKRYHASAEQMSDLMEIDFSKSSRKYTNSQIIMHNKMNETPIMAQSGSIGVTSRLFEQNQSLHKSFESLDIVDCAIPWSPQVTAISAVDNGYLEMRPISSTCTNTITTETQHKIEPQDFINLPTINRTHNENNGAIVKINLTLSGDGNEKSKEELSLNYPNHSNNEKESLSIPGEEHCSVQLSTKADKGDENDNDTDIDNFNSNRTVHINTTDINNKVPLNAINSETKDAIDNKEHFSAHAELSSNENLNNNDCLNLNTTEGLFNMKQQQSLNYLKMQYTKNCSNEHLLSQNNASPTRNVSIAMSNRKIDGSSPIIDKVSLNNVNNLNNTLYYASLDLPVCSNEYSTKSIHQNNLSNENFYDKTLVNNIKNVYAKIDFDHPEALTFTRQNS